MATPLSRSDIIDLTKRFRKACGMEDILYFPIIQFIEWIMVGFGMNFEIVPISVLPNSYAITNPQTGTMWIREDVYDAAAQGNPRHRFTLCHELAHYFLHQPNQIGFARGSIPVYMNPEWQANEFAADLMAPLNLISGMTVDEIAERCGMSYEAASIQYRKANRM